MTRLALLHLSFSKTLVEEFGEKTGKELVIRSILEYGKRVGERTKRGLPDLPKYGVYGEYKDEKVYDCVLAYFVFNHSLTIENTCSLFSGSCLAVTLGKMAS